MKTHNSFHTASRVASIVLAAFVGLMPLTAGADEIVLSNVSSTGTALMEQVKSGVEAPGEALFFPASTMQAYKGCTIRTIKVAVCGATDEGRVFVTSDLNGTPLAEQAFTTAGSGWVDVTLDSPYVVDGSAIYVGFEAKGQRFLAYCKRLVADEEWIKCDTLGWKAYDNGSSSAIKAIVDGDNLPRTNVRLGTLRMPAYALRGAQTACEGEFFNLGLDDVTSLTFSYIVDGNVASTETVTMSGVKPRSKGTFTLAGYTLSDEGEYDLQLRISAVNGSPDPIDADNRSATKRAVCRESFVQRKMLLEVFSTELCVNCAGAHVAIAEAMKDCDDYVELCHHAGFYTDGLTIDASKDYEWFYRPSNLFAPALMADRTNFGEEYPDYYNYGVPVIEGSGSRARLFHDVAMKIPALVSVDMNVALDRETRMVSVNVKGNQLLPVEDADMARLYVFLTEDSIFTTTQRGALGDFWHRHAARKSLTPSWGDAIDLQEGYNADYSFVIPEEWNIDKMSAVAFVAKYNPDDKNDCNVLNANSVELSDATSGISLTANDHSGEAPHAIYNLAGMRLKALPKTATPAQRKQLYIIDGKKVLR